MSVTKATVVKQLKLNNYAILASSSKDCSIHTCAVTYVYDRKCNFWFITKDYTVKYQNIQQSPDVNLAIINTNEMVSINVSGIAVELSSRAEIKEINYRFGRIYKKADIIPPPFKYDGGDFKVIKVKPKRINYCDYSSDQIINEDLVFFVA